jgi:hypothetical protein
LTAGIIQSAQQRIGQTEFDSWQRQDFQLLHNIQPGIGIYLASYPKNIVGSFPEVKQRGYEAYSAELRYGGVIHTRIHHYDVMLFN